MLSGSWQRVGRLVAGNRAYAGAGCCTAVSLRRLSVMPTPPASGPLKILMLHGYTQNGDLMHAKTRALEKHLQKAFPGTTLAYPTGPLRLHPADIPGFDTSKFDSEDDVQAYAWWRRANTSDPPEYVGFEDGLAVVAKVIAEGGPFDGVVGFSQGACLAAMVASLLEGPARKKSFETFMSKSKLAVRYPPTFESLDQPPLKFCVLYCGFRAPGDRYRALYEEPHIQTPTTHVLGSVDTLVDESRSQVLIDACGGDGNVRVIRHPGGHFIPTSKEYLNALGDFVRSTTTAEHGNEAVNEERAEDMEVPF